MMLKGLFSIKKTWSLPKLSSTKSSKKPLMGRLTNDSKFTMPEQKMEEYSRWQGGNPQKVDSNPDFWTLFQSPNLNPSVPWLCQKNPKCSLSPRIMESNKFQLKITAKNSTKIVFNASTIRTGKNRTKSQCWARKFKKFQAKKKLVK